MAEIFYFYVQDDRTIEYCIPEPIMQEDKDVAVWRFRIPKVLNQVDMTNWAWWFVYENAKGEKYSEALMLSDDIDEPGVYSTAEISVGHGMSMHPGNISFALEAIEAIAQVGTIVAEWHTKTYSHKVISTLQGNQAEYAETEHDIISALITEYQNLHVGTNQITDGAVTFAKLANDAVTSVKIADGAVTNGKLASNSVSSDKVQDGAITEAKLADALKPKVIKDYVTPEMFGAVGDGETDDTSAVTQAVASGKPLFFSQFKTYRLADDITFHQSVDFNSATILLDGCSLIVDDGLPSQNHYGFGIIIKNGFFIGDNTNTIIKVQHSTKTTIEDCSFKDFLIGIDIVTGYEHNIDSCRFVGSDTIHATAIRKNDGDGYINNLTGVNCYNALIIVKGKHLVNNIHFWLNSSNLLSGSAMIVYSGAGQSNLKIDYAYFDGYEVGIRKSGLSTLNLNNSNIVMPAALFDGDYYLFDFADANQDFCVAIDNFSTPWSNESNFKLSKDTQKAMFYMGFNKMSYTIRNIVRYYNSNQLTFLNGVTATDVRFTLGKNLLHLKGTITVPSDFTNSKKALTITGIYFPVQQIVLNGQYGTEKLSFTGTDMYILNSVGQTLDVDVVVSYLPQYA